MSFADKLGTLMKRPNDDLVSKDEIPWWLKYSGRGLGTVGGAVALAFGIMSCFLNVLGGMDCILAGIWQALAGFSVLAVEAPCCCMFVDFVQDTSNWADARPYWNRAAYYLIVSLPPVFMCLSFTTFVGSGLIFATGILYGMMALGKKGTTAEMAAVASPTGVPQPGDHRTTLMEDPDVWRP